MADLRDCENCSHRFIAREPGDMADLNHLCRHCAVATATAMELDFNLPLGSSDEDRASVNDLPPNTVVYILTCTTPRCTRYGKTWATSVSLDMWVAHHGRPWHCFLCGERSRYASQYLV